MSKGRLWELQTTKALTCSTPATINQVVIPCIRGLALFLLAICPLAGATTHRVRAGQGRSTIQRVISEASPGDTVSFDAGTYTITSTLSLKCGLTYTGPVATPATAEITTSTTKISLTAMTGGCKSGTTTIEYLHFNGAGPLYVDTSGYSNIVFEHNQVTSLPEESCGGPCESLFFDGNNNNSAANITIEYNIFGDANSCNPPTDEGGCAGILTNIVGTITNLTIRYNTFYHLNEGIHFQNTSYSSAPGAVNSVCGNCDIEYNYFSLINRIALENQISVENNPTIMSNNVFASNNIAGQPYSSMAISGACCLSGRLIASISNAIPTDYIQNNVIFNSTGNTTALALPVGIENQGVNPQVTNNLTQGYVCYGVLWSWGNTGYGGLIANNTFQSPIMAARSNVAGCLAGPGQFIGYECGTGCGIAPTQSRNVRGATPVAITSVAPTISPASGSQTFPLTVTLTDPGYTSGAQPLGNTGIWYTTDGSPPVPGSGTAQYLASGGTFVLPAPGTVKAVGMWGTPNQPTSYPAGYGFVPSAVKSAHYTSGVASRQRRSGNSQYIPGLFKSSRRFCRDPQFPVLAVRMQPDRRRYFFRDTITNVPNQNSCTRAILAQRRGIVGWKDRRRIRSISYDRMHYFEGAA
jgi:hypothetical protein